MSKKDRRNSGRIYPRVTKGVPVKKLIEEGLEPQCYWDDWKDYRDGFRNNKDRSHIYPVTVSWARFDVKKNNDKLRRLLARRKCYRTELYR
jgi:hypothetical protein